MISALWLTCFATYISSGESIPAEKGEYVSKEWHVEHGFNVTVSGGYNLSFKACLFDTGNHACVSSANISLEFGSPNKNCRNGGLGHGDGGKPKNKSGEYCEPNGSKYYDNMSPQQHCLKYVISHQIPTSTLQPQCVCVQQMY
jgi:hypothetical protein